MATEVHHSHNRLLVWQESMRLVATVYRLTDSFPKSERYGLAQQMRRAAVSIPSNIAEGAARSGSRELAHFLGIASGSYAELETRLEIAMQLGFLQRDGELVELLPRVGILLRRLRDSIARKTEN